MNLPSIYSVILSCCLAVSLLLGLAACSNSAQEETSHSLMAQLEQASAHSTASEQDSLVTIEDALIDINYVAVPTSGDDIPVFFSQTRKDKITQYPCSNCHTAPLENMKAESLDDAPQAHWNISLNHASESIMACLTCHTDNDMDSLHSLTGEAIDFDHSYQLCAQCHAPQFKDWQGGAHGKRLEGWAPPRVVHTCPDCHNPHQPAWDIRWPAVTKADPQN